MMHAVLTLRVIFISASSSRKQSWLNKTTLYDSRDPDHEFTWQPVGTNQEKQNKLLIPASQSEQTEQDPFFSSTWPSSLIKGAQCRKQHTKMPYWVSLWHSAKSAWNEFIVWHMTAPLTYTGGLGEFSSQVDELVLPSLFFELELLHNYWLVVVELHLLMNRH